MAVDHYENFPVASLLLPRRLAPAVEAIYAFARSADDLADEGDAAPEERLAALARYARLLDQAPPTGEPLFDRLFVVIRQYSLPLAPFQDLLSAFSQDVGTTRYETYAQLLDYCRRSANPVGRLMLALYGAAGETNVRDADAICTALQLINFWQDVAIDWDKQRIYLPLEDLRSFDVTEAAIAAQEADARWRALMQFEVARTRALMLTGAGLATRLRGRIGWELRLVVQGGLRILERIEAADYDVFRHRPVLRWPDWVVMAWRALRM
ncbi:MAG: squalene synthase HpnC [Telluria sp.]